MVQIGNLRLKAIVLCPMNKSLNVLVLGSGGREHAFCHKISHSPLLGRLFCAPGNPGTARIAENVALNILDAEAVGAFASQNSIELVVVGPEAPLAEGVADALRSKGLDVVGPGKAGAVLESSKEWSKRFMDRHGIPTASYRRFDTSELEDALTYVECHVLPVVIKASGLAAGKGVVIAATHEEAKSTVMDMLSGSAFGSAGSTIVVEEFLTGIEVSVFALTDGKRYVLLPEAKDYKRIGEGDTGPNTGGMGAVSPVSFADAEFMEKVKNRIIDPTIQGLEREGIDYRGFVFFGLIKVGSEPYVIEYNARMGDPETEAVLLRIDSDLLPVLLAAAKGNLEGQTLTFSQTAAVTVVLVSGGYPGDYPKGLPIDLPTAMGSVVCFHSGTQKTSNGELLTQGGRVFAVTALADDVSTARKSALEFAAQVKFEGCYHRRDIGLDLLGMG